jgi:ADP-ribose pyrophosphatase YjhB (NUDIX family)
VEPRWLTAARRLQAVAQNGLLYAESPFDRERYGVVRDVAAQLLADGSGAEVAEVRELLLRETGWATPKVDVRAAIFDGASLLLVREKDDGRWSLPGGYADVHESPAEAIAREVLEETGYVVRVERLLAVYDRSRHDHEPALPHAVYILFFACRIVGGAPSPGFEAQEVAFFAADRLPELSRARVTERQARRLIELAATEAPTEFD